MSSPLDPKSTVVKVALKRVDLCELVQAHELLRMAPFVRAMGVKAEALLKAGVARRYPDGAALFQQGDAGQSLFFVLRGEVRLSALSAGEAVELEIALPGAVCGETEVLSGAPIRTSSAVAQGEVDAAEFPRESLGELAGFLRPIQEGRRKALNEMTHFMNRW